MLAGAATALITSLLFAKFFFKKVGKFLQPVRYFWFIVYLLVMVWECIKANFDVAYRVLHPAMPIKPGIVKVNLSLKSDFARTMLSNSITMTPGTIAVDIVGDVLYVHWIYVSSDEPEEYRQKIVGRFEKYIKKTFE
jgi:multicomponent Na+:H+ antiporter subunit E